MRMRFSSGCRMQRAMCLTDVTLRPGRAYVSGHTPRFPATVDLRVDFNNKIMFPVGCFGLDMAWTRLFVRGIEQG